jgi:restriction system protein
VQSVADITRRRQGEILRVVFEVLRDAPDGLQAKDVIANAEDRLTLTPFEASTYPKQPDVRRFPKIVRFTTISAVKAGWLVKDKGTWTLTDAGAAALDARQDPEELMREAVRRYQAWHRDHLASQPEDDGLGEQDATAETGDEPSALATLEEAIENAATEIREHLAATDPYDFQRLVAALLKAMGYHIIFNAPPGPDQGIDLLAQRDPLGAEGPRVSVQVKRRRDKATVEELRAFLALLADHDIGVFVSLGGFTPEAERLHRQQERRRITLVGFGSLLDLWIEHYNGIDDAARQLLPLRAVHFLAPPD